MEDSVEGVAQSRAVKAGLDSDVEEQGWGEGRKGPRAMSPEGVP